MASEFSKILAGCKDITDDVYNDPLHYQTAEVLDLFERSQPALAEMRHFVEGCFMTPAQWDDSAKDSLPDVGFLCNLQDWFDYYDPEVQQYRDDLFAIDATDSPLIQTLVGQFYEVIVAGIGYSTSMSDPQVFRAQATPALAGKKGFSFDQLIESLTIQDRSWPNTFREYKERELALNCSSQSVIVDGPILTQNLITQPDGEKLTEKILKSGKRVVGVIKNLSASSPEEQISGQVLKDGEAYIITDCRTLLQKRNKTWASSKNKAAWMERVPAKYCRGVYRPGNPTTGQSKYFGFECRIDQLHWALAMMYGERSDTPGHEIPFLLDHVDAFLDGCHDRSSVQARLESVVMEHNPGQAFDLIDSDDFRGK
jgi:hypothetical protein